MFFKVGPKKHTKKSGINGYSKICYRHFANLVARTENAAELLLRQKILRVTQYALVGIRKILKLICFDFF